MHAECEETHENESWIAMVMNFLKKENLSIQELADKLALSPSRLSHLFSEETGTPLKSFLLLNQMFNAFEKLFQGQSITDAALDSGFDSPSHFATTTKKMIIPVLLQFYVMESDNVIQRHAYL